MDHSANQTSIDELLQRNKKRARLLFPSDLSFLDETFGNPLDGRRAAECGSTLELPPHLLAKMTRAQQRKELKSSRALQSRVQSNALVMVDNPTISQGLTKALVSQPKPQWRAPWKLMRASSGHLGWVRSICVEPDNQWFATGSADHTIKIWDLASGRLRLSLTGHIMAVRGLAVSDRSPYLFSGGEDKMVKCWDLEHNKVIRHYHGHHSGVYALDLHPTLDILVTAGRDAVARVWDIRTRQPVHVLTGHKNTVSAVKCQATDPQVITTSMDGTVRLWDLVAGKTMAVLTHHKKGVRALALHPNEYTFATGSADSIKQWKCPEGAFMNNFGPPQNAIINTLSISPDGVMFAGGDDGSLGFYDWKSGHKFQQTQSTPMVGSLQTAENAVSASTFDKTGLRLITCEADKTVKVWKQDPDATPESEPGIPWEPKLVDRY